jgi:uncharacterized membrane protein
MIAIRYQTARAARFAHRVAVVVLLVVCLLFTSPALAAKKKKEEVAAPTKSYVLPYIIVLMLVSVGLMTVCRPGRRLDRVDEKKKSDE